jgi:putative ATPase
VYPHSVSHAVAAQQYAPDELVGREYYRPTEYGSEKPLRQRLGIIRRILGTFGVK